MTENTHTIIFTETSKNSLRRIQSPEVEKVINVLRQLRNNPFLGKKLYGNLSHLLSYFVRPYRIIYEVADDAILIIGISSGHRQEVRKRTAFSECPSICNSIPV